MFAVRDRIAEALRKSDAMQQRVREIEDELAGAATSGVGVGAGMALGARNGGNGVVMPSPGAPTVVVSPTGASRTISNGYLR